MKILSQSDDELRNQEVSGWEKVSFKLNRIFPEKNRKNLHVNIKHDSLDAKAELLKNDLNSKYLIWIQFDKFTWFSHY